MLTYGHMFRVLSCAMGQNMNQALSGMDLTFAQGYILGYLEHCAQPPCAKDMEEKFRLSHPTVSGLLSRMEKKGFIAQKPDPQDRRRKLCDLQPKGKQCCEALAEVIRQGDANLLTGFSPEEAAQFQSYLLRAMRNVSPDFHIPEEEFTK